METVTSGLVVLKKDEWECPRGPAPIWTSCRRSGPTAGSAGRLGPPATCWPASFAALPSAKNSALLEDTMKRVVSLLVVRISTGFRRRLRSADADSTRWRSAPPAPAGRHVPNDG